MNVVLSLGILVTLMRPPWLSINCLLSARPESTASWPIAIKGFENVRDLVNRNSKAGIPHEKLQVISTNLCFQNQHPRAPRDCKALMQMFNSDSFGLIMIQRPYREIRIDGQFHRDIAHKL